MAAAPAPQVLACVTDLPHPTVAPHLAPDTTLAPDPELAWRHRPVPAAFAIAAHREVRVHGIAQLELHSTAASHGQGPPALPFDRALEARGTQARTCQASAASLCMDAACSCQTQRLCDASAWLRFSAFHGQRVFRSKLRSVWSSADLPRAFRLLHPCSTWQTLL